jgi:hypothetical protein
LRHVPHRMRQRPGVLDHLGQVVDVEAAGLAGGLDHLADDLIAAAGAAGVQALTTRWATMRLAGTPNSAMAVAIPVMARDGDLLRPRSRQPATWAESTS